MTFIAFREIIFIGIETDKQNRGLASIIKLLRRQNKVSQYHKHNQDSVRGNEETQWEKHSALFAEKLNGFSLFFKLGNKTRKSHCNSRIKNVQILFSCCKKWCQCNCQAEIYLTALDTLLRQTKKHWLCEL